MSGNGVTAPALRGALRESIVARVHQPLGPLRRVVETLKPTNGPPFQRLSCGHELRDVTYQYGDRRRCHYCVGGGR